MTSVESAPKAEFDEPSWLGKDNERLAYYEFNQDGTETILLLHGAMTGAPEWDMVIPHLPTRYHILAVDTPLHNHSKDVVLNSTNAGRSVGTLLESLVTSRAREGQAHIVGLSMGAHLGRRLAVQCPSIVKTCFLSGYAKLDDLPLRDYIPYAVYAVESIGTMIPKQWIDGIEFATDTQTPKNFAHFKKVWNMIMDNEDIKDAAWSARTLVVAATKGGLIPTNDSLKDAQALAKLAQEGNGHRRVVQNKTIRHAWSRQLPKLFADAVTCWIQCGPLPDTFEAI